MPDTPAQDTVVLSKAQTGAVTERMATPEELMTLQQLVEAERAVLAALEPLPPEDEKKDLGAPAHAVELKEKVPEPAVAVEAPVEAEPEEFQKEQQLVDDWMLEL